MEQAIMRQAGQKMSLMQARCIHNINSRQLAEQAGVALRTAYLAELGGMINAQDAQRLLRALNTLSGHNYTLDSIFLNVPEHFILS